MMKTKITSKNDLIEKWYLIDATGLRAGRIAGVAAELLLGKNDVSTRANLLPKHKVVVTNAEKIDVTDRRKENKIYTRYSGYPDGLTKENLGQVLETKPARVLERAIRGMLPRNKRGDAIFSNNLYVYAGSEHKHEAQQPQLVDVKKFKV